MSDLRVRTRRNLTAVVPLAAIAGVVLGVISKLADEWSGATGWLTSFLCLWLLSSLAVGRLAGSVRAAATGTSVLLLSGVLAYYVTYFVTDGSYPAEIAWIWALLAVVAGPVAGAAADCTRLDSRLGNLSRAAFSGTFLGEGVFVLATAESPSRWVLIVLDVGLGLLLPAVLSTGRRNRWQAYALVPIIASIAFGLFQLSRLALRIL